MMNVIHFKGFWSISDTKKYSNYLFIFGDNDEKFGKRGQAIIRDQYNSIGIPTKKYPRLSINSFYRDNELEQNKHKIDAAFDLIIKRLKTENFEGIVLPENGFGTGLAKLDLYAPLTLQYIQFKTEELVQSLSN